MPEPTASEVSIGDLFRSEKVEAAPSVAPNRRRSNSQSQGTTSVPPKFLHTRTPSAKWNVQKHHQLHPQQPGEHRPPRRHQAEFYVTLVPLNDTFTKKHLHVPYYPDTTRLGRPTGTKVKPQTNNGYFDLRVLSRNHACMYIEPKTGQLMIQDMGLSNGTFVNLEKIATDPVAVNIGDTINLGFNIQVETSHKQISAKVDNITIVSNNPQGPVMAGLPRLTQDVIANLGAADLRHLDFLQGVFGKPGPDADPHEDADVALVTQRSIEALMFLDLVPAHPSPSDAAVGIFSNSKIVHSADIELALVMLTVNLAKARQQNAALKTLENFLCNYNSQVAEMTRRLVAAEVKKNEDRFEKTLQAERERAKTLFEEQEAKFAAARMRATLLESEVAKLRSENEHLGLRLETAEKWASSAVRDPHTARNGTSVASATPSFPKELSPVALAEEVSNSSDVDSVVAREPVSEPAAPRKPQHPGLQVPLYRSPALILGVSVVVAGLLYKAKVT